MSERTALSGEASEDHPGWEKHFLSGVSDTVYAQPGTLFVETEKLHEGRAIRRRYLGVIDGKESVIYDGLERV